MAVREKPKRKKPTKRRQRGPILARIWAFKAFGLTDLDRHFYASHRYRNTLVELELSRRAAVDREIADKCPWLKETEEAIERVKAAIEEAEGEVKRGRAKVRARTSATNEQRTAIASLKAERKRLFAQRKEMRAAAFIDTTLSEIEDAHKVAINAAYNESPAFWGTKVWRNQASKQHRKGIPPTFKRYNGDGVIALQFQTQSGVPGLTWEQATACRDSSLRIEIQPLDSRPTHNRRGVALPVADPSRNRSKNKFRAIVWFRIGSEGRDPIWTKFTIHLYRQPLPDTIISWATLRRRYVGQRATWEFQVTLGRSEWDKATYEPTLTTPPSGEVGINLNWRLIEGNLQVPYAVGADGDETIAAIPMGWVSAWRKAESLQSIRDLNFNAIRAQLTAWFATADGSVLMPYAHSFDPNATEATLGDRTANLAKWRSTKKLARLVTDWRNHRIPGDDVIFAALEEWRKQDRHLQDWSEAQEEKAVARRNDHYRKFARQLARRYQCVCLANTNYKDMKARPKVEDDDTKDAARFYSDIAAVGTLNAYLIEAFQSHKFKEAANITRECSLCGHINDVAPDDVLFVCQGCGVELDRDWNAAKNLLTRPEVVKDKKTGKWLQVE